MAGTDLTFYLKKCLHAIVERVKDEGDLKVHMFSFSRSYNSGCGGHPGMEDHVLIARGLTDFISILKEW
jgi:hypothetical protein